MLALLSRGAPLETEDLDELVLDGGGVVEHAVGPVPANAATKPYATRGAGNNGPVSTATAAQPLATLHQARMLNYDPGGFNARWLHENVSASSLIRIRVDESQLISGPGNGLTFYVGITGLNGNALKFTAVAAASEVRALASGCAITVSDLTGGDRLPGYLG